ncbi:MAG: PQQ-dependent sugar dehydrogenase [Candidatus Eisenbacteria bacterium]
MSRLVFALLCTGAIAPRGAHAALTLPTGFGDSTYYSGIGLPVAMAFVPGPAAKGTRVLVLEQKLPRVHLLVNGALAPPPPQGQIDSVDWVPGEKGALSLAVDPRWPAHPYVYTHYTSLAGGIHIVRYRMTGDLSFAGNGIVGVDASTKLKLITDIPDVNTNHNGGSLRFGPDGMLYASMGDDQQTCIAQDTTSLAGKLLRLDVTRLPASGNGPIPRALITPPDNPHAASPDSNWRLVYALGLRNPFRMHIDPVDGAIFIADVGQSVYEEIDRITGPANLGWPWYENATPYTSCGGSPPAGLTFPVATLVNPPSRSIISLGPYRRPVGATQPFPPEYEGDYFYSDYFSGVVRRIGFDGTNWVSKPAAGQPTATDWAGGAQAVVDAAVGPDGALWYLVQSVNGGFNNGAVHRVSWAAAPDTLTAVPTPPNLRVALAPPRPTPSRGDVQLRYTLEREVWRELAIFDLLGRRVRTLARSAAAAGEHAVTWDGRDDHGVRARAGMYLVRLLAGGEQRTRRVLLTD